ncbi:MAG TPA: prolyl oligopeptidase family serine peptidase [Planctomycetota bacterium]|nr:prolyl oligopeptidase family serine peptidase [Planctomycetota bacterium]
MRTGACCLALLGMALAGEAEPPKASTQFGAQRLDFVLGGHRAFVILPPKAAPDGSKPWLWYAPTFIGAHPDPSHTWMFGQLLARGFAICGIEVGESFGSPKGRAAYTALYEHATKTYGLAPKACLLPQSRGGLMLYNWAVEHPEWVQCIGGIYTVCDLTSYPGLARACGAYNLTEAELKERLNEHNPVERLAPLAKAKVPILHLHGDADKVVPLERNSGELARRYRALGRPIELIVVKGKGHQVCDEFFHSQRLVDFFLSGGQGVR